MDMLDALKNDYESYDEDGRLRSKNGMVEYLTTMRYVEKYLKPGMRILEIGAGTGRYSHSPKHKNPAPEAHEMGLRNGSRDEIPGGGCREAAPPCARPFTGSRRSSP